LHALTQMLLAASATVRSSWTTNDNRQYLSSHKATGVAEAITAQGTQLVYLPPYSPDLNPIEQAFAKFKAVLRRAAQRTRDDLWQIIRRILERYQPQKCRNLFSNVGYAI
jgi:transposase